MADKKKMVIIDPGHGGIDPGCETKDKNGKWVYERDIVWAVAKKIKDKLDAAEAQSLVKAVISLEEMYPGYDYTKVSKRPSLRNRVYVPWQKYHEEFDIKLSLSLHCDAAESAAAQDATIFYSEDSDLQLAERFLNDYAEKVIVDGVQVFFGHRKPPVVERENLSVLNAAEFKGIDGVLLELGFLTSSDDFQFLIRADVQDLIAEVLNNTIIELYGEKV